MRGKTSFLVKKVGIFEEIPENLFDGTKRGKDESRFYSKPHIEILDDNDYSVNSKIREAERIIEYKQKDIGAGI